MLTRRNFSNNLIAFCFLKFVFIQNVLSTEQLPPHYVQNENSFRKAMSIIEDTSWTLKGFENFKFSQVAGIAFNKPVLSIFHRSTVVWDENSFKNEIYMHQDQPIGLDAILNFNLSGHFISSFGKNHFFMPHGLSYDPDGNIWTTDVALHQVFRFNKNNLTSPELVLGERFVPNNDTKHFCKPTDVQVANKNKMVFISDGYCNSRVMVFDYDGRFIKQFGSEQGIIVSHSLSLIEELDLICVADRENGRAFCYNAGIQNQSRLGELNKELKTYFNGKLYAIQNIGTYLFGVLIYQSSNLSRNTKALLFDLKKDSGEELIWQKDLSLSIPHDITIDDENNIYISEIDNKLKKLVKKFATDLNLNSRKSYSLKLENKEKSKRIDENKSKEEEDLKRLTISTTTESNSKELSSSQLSTNNEKEKSKKSSLLLFIVLVSSLLLISIILFFLKKRIGIEHYFRSFGLPTKVVYSKDLYIHDPERAGFNILREEEENLFDFELENNSSESEVEEFNFKHVRKV